MLEAVIFDLDGVLIDSVPSAQRVRQRLLAEHDVDFASLPDATGEQHKGSSLRTLLATVKQYYPDTDIDFEDMARKQTESVLEDLQARQVTAEPALVSLLDSLASHDVKLAVATAGLREAVEGKLGLLGVRQYFQEVITASDVAQHKPDPASYLLAIKWLHVAPESCVIFEDSTPGVEAGNAAGCKVVGFTRYNETKAQMANTVLTVGSWSEVSYERLSALVG